MTVAEIKKVLIIGRTSMDAAMAAPHHEDLSGYTIDCLSVDAAYRALRAAKRSDKCHEIIYASPTLSPDDFEHIRQLRRHTETFTVKVPVDILKRYQHQLNAMNVNTVPALC